MMKKILLTAFEPFGGRAVNASECLVAAACRRRRDLEALVLPVDHAAAAEALTTALEACAPSVLLMTGEWGGPRYRIEAFARPGPLVPTARGVRAARWPLARARGAMAARGLSVALSGDAGRYVCDTTFWVALGRVVPMVGFLHVPHAAAEARARDVGAVLACLAAATGPARSITQPARNG